MPILDGDMIFSDAQAVTTATATDSTNVIDFGAAHVGAGQKVICTVGTAVGSTGTANVTFKVITSATEAFTVPVELYTTAAIAKATLVAGYKVFEFTLPWEVKQYVKVTYTPDTTDLNAGKFYAWVESKAQTNGV